MRYGRCVFEEVSVHRLRTHTAEVLRRVEAGETLRVTVGQRQVAELVPVPARDTWVPRGRARAALVQADAALRRELDRVVRDSVGEA